MRSFLRASMTHTGLVALLVLGGCAVGCDGDVGGLGPEDEDTGFLDETGTQETGIPDTTVPDTGMPETDMPETDLPETDLPETDTPETDTPETDTPETGIEDTGDVDAGEMDAGEMDAGEMDAGDMDTGAVDTGVDTGCGAPTSGTWHVAPTGSDTTGNGSAACPFKTIGKALSSTTAGPAVATTIVLANGTGAAPNVYGTSCTGGAPCDSGAIIVPAEFGAAVTIRGAGARDQVVVATGGNPVVSFKRSDASLESLTVRATGTNTGVIYDAAAAGTPGGLRDVRIVGTSTSGSGIVVEGAANPILGGGTAGGLAIETVGSHAIFVRGSAAPQLTGSEAAPTLIAGATNSCVRVEGTGTDAPTLTTSSVGTTPRITIRNCGVGGAIVLDTVAVTNSTLSGVAIGRTATVTTTYPGISLLNNARAAVNNSTISGLLNNGISLVGSTQLTSTGGLSVSGNTGHGILVGGTASADLNGASLRGQLGTGDGIHCSSLGGTLKLRNSTMLSNAGNGVRVAGNCGADLGGTEAANNAFNTDTQRNGASGLCISSTFGPVAANASKWRCAMPPGSGCAPGTPAPGTVLPAGFSCRNLVDYTVAGGVAFSTPGIQECCNAVP